MPDTAAAIFNATARCLRKVRRSRRFNRVKAARRCQRQVKQFWMDGIDALFSFMAQDDGWEKLQRHVQLAIAAETFTKAISEADKRFLTELLTSFGYFNEVDVAKATSVIMRATSVATFEEAAKFALGSLGVVAPDFELRNERVLELLESRSQAAVFSTKTYIDDAFSTITTQFYELGRHPYSQETLDGLKKALGYKADWEAKRFALTETGIAAELAQAETYRRNGVKGKQWNILDMNTRPSHIVLAGAVVGIEDKFDVGGNPADHPLDPKLPPEELCNCHCWLSPVLEDDFQVDPANVWEGQ